MKKVKKISNIVKLSTYVLLLMVSFSIGFCAVKKYNPNKQERIEYIEHIPVISGNSFSLGLMNELEQRELLKEASKMKGLDFEGAYLVMLLGVLIFCFVNIVFAPELIETYKSSKRVIGNIKPKLNELEEELKKIDAMDNKVEAIVRLFQVISPIQDAGGFSQEMFKLNKHNRRGRLNNQVKALEALQTHFHNAGRSEYGINRTTKGEEVTTEKVFLGNVFGLWTKTAAYWLSKKSDSDWYLINDHQCGSFVKSHVDGILKQIAVLKSAV